MHLLRCCICCISDVLQEQPAVPGQNVRSSFRQPAFGWVRLGQAACSYAVRCPEGPCSLLQALPQPCRACSTNTCWACVLWSHQFSLCAFRWISFGVKYHCLGPHWNPSAPSCPTTSLGGSPGQSCSQDSSFFKSCDSQHWLPLCTFKSVFACETWTILKGHWVMNTLFCLSKIKRGMLAACHFPAAVACYQRGSLQGCARGEACKDDVWVLDQGEGDFVPRAIS